MVANGTPSLDLIFGALADPTRRSILERLSRGEASITELTERFEISQPAISRHVKVLERAGLVERSRRAQLRPCTLRPEPLAAAARWIGGYVDFHEASYDNLATYLEGLQPPSDD